MPEFTEQLVQPPFPKLHKLRGHWEEEKLLGRRTKFGYTAGRSIGGGGRYTLYMCSALSNKHPKYCVLSIFAKIP